MVILTKYSTPFSHYILSQFLSQQNFKLLKKCVLKQKFKRFDSDLFSFLQSKNLLISKNKSITYFCNFLKSLEFLQMLQSLTNKKLNGVVDVSAFMYKKGDYLLPHDDLVTEKDKKRKLAYIFYLSSLRKSDGGALDLYKKGKIVKSFIPKENNLIIFSVSRHSFHQVREVIKNKKRISLAGWFYG